MINISYFYNGTINLDKNSVLRIKTFAAIISMLM